VKARKVKGLDPGGALADNLERIVHVRCDELHGFMPKAAKPRKVRALHDMRIAAKRLRYVLELSDGCFGPYARTARRRTKELQDLLGEIHDCDVILPRLESMIADTPPADAAHHGLEALAADRRARRERLFAEFLEQWEQLARDGFRARLEHAIGERPITPSSQVDNGGGAADGLLSEGPG
jgi:CHAD domain-containing protein